MMSNNHKNNSGQFKDPSGKTDLKVRADSKLMDFSNINVDIIESNEKKQIKNLIKRIRGNILLLKDKY